MTPYLTLKTDTVVSGTFLMSVRIRDVTALAPADRAGWCTQQKVQAHLNYVETCRGVNCAPRRRPCTIRRAPSLCSSTANKVSISSTGMPTSRRESPSPTARMACRRRTRTRCARFPCVRMKNSSNSDARTGVRGRHRAVQIQDETLPSIHGRGEGILLQPSLGRVGEIRRFALARRRHARQSAPLHRDGPRRTDHLTDGSARLRKLSSLRRRPTDRRSTKPRRVPASPAATHPAGRRAYPADDDDEANVHAKSIRDRLHDMFLRTHE